MPKRTDIEKILIIGAGPIIIGQACEFDYSGSQACKALREEGFTVVLVNSNPATIMTDPDTAERTYVEPVTAEAVEKIIALEHPDALLPTVGGQTGLNTTVELVENGVLDKYGVRLIGARIEAIRKAEDRLEFKAAMARIGLETPRSAVVHDMDEARRALEEIGLPCVLRPSFTLGGTGGGVAFNKTEFETICTRGLYLSPVNEVLVEESVLGWKEYELEVMRDGKDNAVVVCSIENFDPMGIHTGDSITVAPAQTLTDKEYQRLRDAAFAVIREIGVETGGSNIQFCVEPQTGRLMLIEMNPRVSRSSALASKATGFPIAKIAAKLAVGYTLDELPNDITRETPAGFEPTLDYVVVKVPRFAFEKFPAADSTLTTQMKSVGEVMTIGRTFKEAFQKAWRGLETGHAGFGRRKNRPPETESNMEQLCRELTVPTAGRVSAVYQALHEGFSVEQLHELTAIDPWFLENLRELADMEKRLRAVASLDGAGPQLLREAKQAGFSDIQLSSFWKVSEKEVRRRRLEAGVRAGYKLVDTCAAEFEAATPYYYSAYEDEDEVRVSDKKKIMILGGGPNRIGQGIEFDYCCCHAAFAMRELGYESIMVNSNPETVSTDYDTSDLLFFEPLTLEDVLNIHDALKPDGTIVQFGGQTPLNLARALRDAGVKIVGTAVEEIERAEDRRLFNELISRLGLTQPPGATATSMKEAKKIAARIGYPVLIRPSFVLGGRAMEICYEPAQAEEYLRAAFDVAGDAPVLIDKFIEDAIEVDVDAVSDGHGFRVAGLLEHIEEAGTHSGDAAMCLPPHSLSDAQCAKLVEITERLARDLNVCGLLNVQFAVKGGTAYILEVNPRASRTVPFIGKATGIPWAKIAAKCMVGVSLAEQGLGPTPQPQHLAVKESVFPFNKFPGNDIVLGPEMKSTGEVMGVDTDFGRAFAKAQMAAGQKLPLAGEVFISVCDKDKREAAVVAERLRKLGFELLATAGTHKALTRQGVSSTVVKKIREGRPNLIDLVEDGRVVLAINTPSGRGHRTDEAKIRSHLTVRNIPCITTMAAAQATVTGIAHMKDGWGVRALQTYYKDK